MKAVTDAIQDLFEKKIAGNILSIEKLPQSGGDRVYFRLTCEDAPFPTCLATCNANIRENETFLYFTSVFACCSNVPQIYAVSDNRTIYLQEDFGNASLLSVLEQRGADQSVFSLYENSLKSLANLQVKADKLIDYSRCITSKEFGKSAILSDLLYFKYYFLDTLKLPYDKEALIRDFETLSDYLAGTGSKGFMFRDFQARNIMVRDETVHFIDYQGGMKGALQYDVASLLWQAKAELSDDWKNKLLDRYIDFLDELLPAPVERKTFINQYNGYVLIRLLQVLGAYGFRGLFERRAHFLSSIPLALQNLGSFLHVNKIDLQLPEFYSLLNLVTGKDVLDRFSIKKADRSTPLVVYINSFSYLQRGYPPDPSTHGGGFVFDCRGILNPGRIHEFKLLTGRDKEVIDYLEQQTNMTEFLISVFNIVDISVADYIERNFDCLTINFGCTGGRHRSVYAADSLARHLRNKFGVKIKLAHLEQGIHEQKL